MSADYTLISNFESSEDKSLFISFTLGPMLTRSKKDAKVTASLYVYILCEGTF